MKYLLLLAGVVGAAVAYELVARLTQRNDIYEEARKDRIRVLNRQGQPPSEIYY